MPIPDFQSIMLPLLKCLSDRSERSMRDLTEKLAADYKLTDDEKDERLPSGEQRVFNNRVAWSKSHLKGAGLLDSPSRGYVRITDLGIKLLKQNPDRINVKFLKQYPSYCAFIGKPTSADSKPSRTITIVPEDDLRTPLELIDGSFLTLQQATADDLLARLKSCPPSFFEIVVVKLLMAMGYGGIAGEGNVTGKSGDGGIDGVIKQDKLGLDVVCIQAKRWDGPVGRPIIQGFVGSMDYIRARKGVIITTSVFTREGQDFVDRIEGKKVVLINGEQLTKLMIEHNLGVTTTKTYELKEVSNDFFDESEM